MITGPVVVILRGEVLRDQDGRPAILRVYLDSDPDKTLALVGPPDPWGET